MTAPGGGVGSVHGRIIIEYDNRGVARARNDLGQFVSLASVMGNQIDDSTNKGAKGFRLFGKEILKILGVIALAASAMVSLANAANLVILAAVALSEVAGAGLAVLPGIILSLVAAFAVLKISLAGVGDALKAAASGDAEKLDEALKKLAPSARETVLAFRDLVNAARPIQQAMQQAFFTGLAPQVAGISRAIALLGPTATQVAASMGSIVREALGFVSLPGTIGQLNSVLAGVKGFIDGIRQGVQPLLVGFTQLAAQVGTFGAVIGQNFGKALASFGQFMQGINLAEQLDRVGAIMAPIIDLFRNLGSIVSSVFSALTTAGGGALGVIGELVGQLAGFLKSNEGATAMAALGLAIQQVAGAAGQALLALLRQVGPIIAALAPVVGVLATAIGGILATAFQAIGPPILTLIQALAGALMPVLPQIAAAFTSLAPTIGQIAGLLGGVLGPLLAGLAPVIGALAQVLAGTLNAALQSVLPALQEYVPVFGQLAQQMLPMLIPLIQELGRAFIALAPMIGLVLNAVVGLLVPLMQAASPAIMTLVTALTFLVGIFATVVGWITQLVTRFNLLQVVVNLVGAVVRAIGAAWQWLYNLLLGGSIIPDIVNGMLSWFRMGVSAAIGVWSAITGALSAIWNGIRSVATAAWNGIVSAVQNAISNVRGAIQALAALPGLVGGFFRGMASAASGAVGGLISVARSIPGQVMGALGNLGGLLFGAGRSIIQGLVNGIRSMAGAVSDAVSSVMSAARNLLPFSPAKEGPFSGKGWTLYSGQSMMTDLARGLIRGRQAVVDAMNGTMAGLSTGIAVGVSGTSSGATNGGSTPAGTTLTVHQTVNALPGMDARAVGAMSIERLAFGLSTGTTSVVGV